MAYVRLYRYWCRLGPPHPNLKPLLVPKLYWYHLYHTNLHGRITVLKKGYVFVTCRKGMIPVPVQDAHGLLPHRLKSSSVGKSLVLDPEINITGFQVKYW